MLQSLLYPPQTKLQGYIVILMSVRSFVRSSVRPSVRPSQSLIRYSSKTAEQNFMKLSGFVHYMMPYCTSYFKFLSAWFWGVPQQNKDFAIQNMGELGYHFLSIAHSISSFSNRFIYHFEKKIERRMIDFDSITFNAPVIELIIVLSLF